MDGSTAGAQPVTGRIFISGGTGFVGRNLQAALAGRPLRLLVRDRSRSASASEGDVEYVEGDVTDPDSLEGALDGCEAAISLAAIIEERGRNTFDAVIRQGNIYLVAAANMAGIGRFILMSALGARHDPAFPYFEAKWQAEQAIRGSGMRYTIFRPSWVYGPEDNALNRFVKLARVLPFVPVVGDGKQRMQPVFVADVARCVVESLTNDAAANQVFEIGGPDVMTMDEVLRTMLTVLGKRKPLLHAPAALPKLAGALMAPLPNRPLSPDAVEFITSDALADNSAVLRAFDVRLTPLREGLSTYLGR